MAMIFGYVRVSSLEQAGDGKSSLSQQEQRIRGAALMRGESDPVMITDAGVSGAMPLAKRPAGGRMYADLKDGDLIIASKLDRMFRSAQDALATVQALHDKGVGVILCDINMEPIAENGIGKMFFTLLAAVAEFERWRIAERCADGRRGKAKRGGHIGGAAPYGFSKVGAGPEAVLVQNDDEQNVIKAASALKGQSLRKIGARLADMGFYDRAGTPFAPMQVKRILERVSQ